MAAGKSVYIIAGEESGDMLGARLMHHLARIQPGVTFHGIGGRHMAQAGMQSLFPMTDLSVMGVFEILPRLPHLLKRITETVRDIERLAPDIVVTIDSPDFCKRVVRRARKTCPDTHFIHYVAPTVWAWREGRAATMAELFDGLICLLPFEPPYFEQHALRSRFCGHPLLERITDDAPPRQPDTILILPGSRRGEVRRMAPVFAETFRRLSARHPVLKARIVALPHVKAEITDAFKGIDADYVSPDKRYEAFKTAGFALATSGTVGLELAVAQCPHIIGYKMNPLTFALVRLLVKTPYAHLVNIMQGREVIPEFIQGDCTADHIVQSLENLPKQELEGVRDQLAGADPSKPPSLQAAEFVASFFDLKAKRIR